MNTTFVNYDVNLLFQTLLSSILGWEQTRDFMNQIQAVVNYWMVNVSYSVSVSDTV